MSDPQFPVSFSIGVPPGEDRDRRICDTCGFIDYANPRIVTGVVAHQNSRILLCRRAIEPRRGFWTLPAGFLELGESVEEGARRESREEACAELELETLLGLYSIPRIGQVQIFFRARLMNDPSPGPESQYCLSCLRIHRHSESSAASYPVVGRQHRRHHRLRTQRSRIVVQLVAGIDKPCHQ